MVIQNVPYKEPEGVKTLKNVREYMEEYLHETYSPLRRRKMKHAINELDDMIDSMNRKAVAMSKPPERIKDHKLRLNHEAVD